MEKAKTIICSVDFSDSSKHALQWAVAIAQQLHVHLTVLYTFRLMRSQNEEVLLMKKKMEEDATKNFSAWEKELLIGKELSYDFKTEVGFITDRIEDHARKNPIGFLVMGKNSSTGSKESFDELVGHIDVPLVIVP
jgi:nucleotide-binding universal stress UspA family protein